MRVSRVPAEITSVEDRIVGDLSLPQLVLLSFPALVVAGIYLAVPPTMGITTSKVLLVVALSLICVVLAVRRDGRLLGSWLKEWLVFILRHHTYVSDKNSLSLRPTEVISRDNHPRTAARKAKKRKPPDRGSTSIREVLSDAVTVTYTRKGKIYVQLHQKG